MNGGKNVSTGIIRRIDELGRIVIPKELRKTLHIKDGDNLEIVLDGDDIVLRKYSQIENAVDMACVYAESFYQVLKYNIVITDMDKVVAISGPIKKKYLNMKISDTLENMIIRRDNFVSRKKDYIEICPGVSEYGYYAASTIVHNGDSIGMVIILSLDTPMLEQEEKLAMILANMLSNYFI